MNLRPYFYAPLIFALLFAQQGAVLHALSHLSEPVPAQSQQQQDKQLPHSPVCDKCLAYSSVGSALHSAPPLFHAPGMLSVQTSVPSAGFFTPALFPYASRAPPDLA